MSNKAELVDRFIRDLVYLFDARDQGRPLPELLQIAQKVTLGESICRAIAVAKLSAPGQFEFMEFGKSSNEKSLVLSTSATMHDQYLKMALAAKREIFYKAGEFKYCSYPADLGLSSETVLIFELSKQNQPGSLPDAQLALIVRALSPITQARAAEKKVILRGGGGVIASSWKKQKISALLVQGFTNKEIASQLKLSQANVRYEIIKLYEFLGVKNRAQAAAALLERGINDFHTT